MSVGKVGNKVVPEPLESPPFDVKVWREQLRALGAADFLPEGRPEQPPLPEDEPSLD